MLRWLKLLLNLCAVVGLCACAAAATSAPSRPTATTTLYTPLVSKAGLWQPAPGTSWQWQLSGALDLNVSAQVYDVDLFDTPASSVAELRQRGVKTICYISVGSWEEWRPDAADFPSAIIGSDYAGWPGERWLDIRRIDLLGPILERRFDLCRAKGFDAIEPDNIDGYANATGFPLTAADQLAFNRWLASQAHQRGLSIGLKNDADQLAELLPDFDFAITEDCFDQGWCDQMQPLIAANKAVFAAEYTDTGSTTAAFCPQAAALHISAILKHRDLDAYRETCP